jgi:hypoxanthine phosphoribosyltransferase
VNRAAVSPWSEKIGPVFLSEEQIQQRITELGAEISRDYAGKDVLVIGVLRGVLFFMADLLRAITIPTAYDVLAISRYGPTEQTHGVVRLTKDLNAPLMGKHALLVEDIIDTGLTTHFILRTLRLQEPASLKACILLNRTRRRIIDVDLAYVGFEIPDQYLVGYGLDFREQFRTLPYLAKFEPD